MLRADRKHIGGGMFLHPQSCWTGKGKTTNAMLVEYREETGDPAAQRMPDEVDRCGQFQLVEERGVMNSIVQYGIDCRIIVRGAESWMDRDYKATPLGERQ